MTDLEFDRRRLEEAERLLEAQGFAEKRAEHLKAGKNDLAEKQAAKIEELGFKVVDLPDGSFFLSQDALSRAVQPPVTGH